MAVAAAQKNREMFAIKKSYSIEVSPAFKSTESAKLGESNWQFVEKFDTRIVRER
jgi:hypothetical protein